jgi:cytoskeletal protein CcmA (bactofilin family)
MATYTASNAIKKITTGDESGSWGNSTNNNFDIIDRAANGFVSIALSGTSYTLALSTTAVLSNGHYKAIKFTGTPGGTCTVTLEQNDKARMYMILNSTNQSLSITQGSGSNVTILTGKSAIILADGAGSGAAVTDFTALVSISELDGITAGTVTASKAVVVDANKDITGFRNITATGELDAATLDISGDADIDGTTNLDIVNIAETTTIATDNKIQFRDTGLYINSSADGQLDIVADTEIQIAATTIDIDGAVALNGAITGATNITLSGELDAATLDISGNADIDGTLETDALSIAGTAVTSTAAELNIMDGDTSASDVTIVDADQFVLNDGGTMKQVAATKLSAYVESIGVNQQWYDVTGSRSVGSSYENTYGRAIMVSVGTTISTEVYLQVSHNGSSWVNVGTLGGHGGINDSGSSQAIVPAGHYYKATGGSVKAWAELR